MTSRVLLHVGTPKTGTSYLQEVLFRNRRVLEGAGIRYPADRFDAHFLAALDLMRLPWGGLEREAIGAWDRLAGQVRRHRGTSIISHEILATASRSQVARALDSLGHDGTPQGTEVHVMLSVRDLVRQIPAEWQENVKHRSPISYQRFLDRDPRPATPDPDRQLVLGRPGDPGHPRALGSRAATGTDPSDHRAAAGRSARVVVEAVQPGLRPRRPRSRPRGGAGQPVTRRARDGIAAPDQQVRQRRRRADRLPSPGPRAARPPDVVAAHPVATARVASRRAPLGDEVADSWIAEISARGYDVIGELADLVGAPATDDWCDPDQPVERQVASAGVDAIKALLLENARLLRVEDQLRIELDETYRALERSYLRPTYRARAKTVRFLQASRLGRGALKAYRRVRGRSSRSA